LNFSTLKLKRNITLYVSFITFETIRRYFKSKYKISKDNLLIYLETIIVIKIQ